MTSDRPDPDRSFKLNPDGTFKLNSGTLLAVVVEASEPEGGFEAEHGSPALSIAIVGKDGFHEPSDVAVGELLLMAATEVYKEALRENPSVRDAALRSMALHLVSFKASLVDLN